MRQLRWTPHALDGLAEREVDQSEVEWTIRQPTERAPGRNDRTVFLRRYHDRILGQEMLLVVVAEERAEEIVIITVYKTSKFNRYLRGAD
ncbi:MAG: DUF4258 domain-containing protein [Ardenticatenales bacterium]|nr:DUF4258 domain-containing protein [Ardenticatenales bacterium]